MPYDKNEPIIGAAFDSIFLNFILDYLIIVNKTKKKTRKYSLKLVFRIE